MYFLIQYFVRQGIFANIITIFLITVGLYSLFTIRKEVFPNVNYDIVTVNTIFPGASPEEVERLVTNVIERELRELDGVRDLNSLSRENQSFIIIQVDPDETNSDKIRQDTQNIIDRIDNLPADAETPIVVELDSSIQPIIKLSVSGEIDEIELREIARHLEREIEFVEGVARVSPQGLRELEIRVDARLVDLSEYRISLEEIITALRNQNISIPGGQVDTSREFAKNPERIIRTIGEFQTIEDVKNTVIRSNELGEPIFIGDVADVFFDLERPRDLFRTNGEPAINLTIMKKEKADAVDMVDRVREYVSGLSGDIREGVHLKFIDDSSEFIKRRLGVLSNNLLVGLILIVFFLSLILPWRVAVVTAICIPISFLGTLLYFDIANISLNLLSMLGLIIVAGMLVDGAIVVTDNTVRFLEDGEGPQDAAIKGTHQVWAPITASLLTTIFAFLPMMFMSGIFGKFVFHIPLGVIVALLLSMVVCFFILPYHIQKWYGPVVRRQRASGLPPRKSLFDRLWTSYMVPLYLAILRKCLKLRYLVMLATIFLFAGSIFMATKHMRFILFPPGMVEVFRIQTEAPVGTSLEKHLSFIRPLEDVISQLPSSELRDFTTHIGRVESRPGDPQSRMGSQYAQINVYLTPDSRRDRTAADIIEYLREKTQELPGFESLTFSQISGGPPVGAPVSVGVKGDNYDEILAVVKRVEDFLHSYEGVIDITNNYTLGKEEFRIFVNSAEAAAAQLSVGQIGSTVRGVYEGIISTSLRTFDEEIDVRVSLERGLRSTHESLDKIFVPNSRGDLVPLSRVTYIEKGQGIEVYEHDNYRREVRVTADVLTDIATSNEVMGAISQNSASFTEGYENISLNLTGEARDTQESLQSLLKAFVIAMMGIFFILILLFGQILQTFIILLTIPLGVIAAIWTFYFHGQPLSFMGMLGIVALGGVIVNNSIVFVDFVNQSRREGADRFESILNAGKVRIRPIFLTTVTTVSGLLPTAYGLGGTDLFIVPIALVLAWGVFAGSILMAIIIPSALGIVDDLQSLGARFLVTKE